MSLESVATAAQRNDPAAQFELGVRLGNGAGMSTNTQEAFRWFKSAADLGHVGAAYEVGRAYTFGDGIQTNYSEALRWYETAAKQGYLPARHNLALAYARGRGVSTNLVEAEKHFRIAAEAGLPESQHALAMLLSRDGADWAMLRESFNWAMKAARSGMTLAEEFVGLAYAKGRGVLKDFSEAEKWLLRAAVKEDPVAQCDLANIYSGMYGAGIANMPEAMRWFRKSAGHNYTVAQNNLGFLLTTQPTNSEAEKAEGARVLRAAFEQGYLFAAANLGLCYKKGIGVPEDKEYAFALFKIGAEAGIPTCQRLMGVALQHGDGVAPDNVAAARMFHLAADQRESAAEMILGECYEKGIGVSADEEQALRWYERAALHGEAMARDHLWRHYGLREPYQRALIDDLQWIIPLAEKGDVECEVAVGERLLRGWGTKRDPESAITLLSQAHEKGHPKATFLLANCYLEGSGVNLDLERGLALHRQNADAEFADSQVALAKIYSFVKERRDLDKAISLFKRAAAKGHIEALMWLGTAYLNGEGVAKDEQQATNLLTKAALGDNHLARYTLGKWFHTRNQFKEAAGLILRSAEAGLAESQLFAYLLYRDGQGVTTNAETAAQWCIRAASSGDLDAIRTASELYKRGTGVAQDDQKAFEWLLKGAQAGDVRSQYNVAFDFMKKEDFTEAARWWRKAAEKGLSQAQNSLGYSYEKGKGVEQDLAEAYKWYSLAIEQKEGNAKINMDRLLPRMSAEQVEEGKRRYAAAPRAVETSKLR
jgi:TPR repeat protein